MTPTSWRGRPLFLLITLTVVNAINWADRQVVPILLPAIKGELGLSDTDIGLISGVAFSLIYAVAAFVFGYLADRGARRRILVFGLVSWSFATAAGGFADSFWTLFLARFFTGIGEASLYPCAMAMLVDGFPADQRGRAMGVFGAAAAIGGGLGISLGGWLVEIVGWRQVFLIYGASGVLVLPMLLLLLEPSRSLVTTSDESPVRIVRELLGDARLVCIWLTGAMLIAVATSWITWAPMYFERDLGFQVSEIGVIFGVALLFGGVGGSVLGGKLGDTYRARRFAGQLDVSAVAALVMVPAVAVALLGMPHAILMVAAVIGPFAIFATFPNLQAVVAELVPGNRLGLTFAVHVLFLSGLGAALGPLLVGWISDVTGSLRVALLVPMFGAVLSAIGAWLSGRIVRARTPEAVA